MVVHILVEHEHLGKPNHCWYTSEFWLLRRRWRKKKHTSDLFRIHGKIAGIKGINLGPMIAPDMVRSLAFMEQSPLLSLGSDQLTNRCGADWRSIGCYWYSFKESEVSATLWRFIVIYIHVENCWKQFMMVSMAAIKWSTTLASNLKSSQYPSTFWWWSYEIVANFWLWMAMWTCDNTKFDSESHLGQRISHVILL